MNSSPKKLLCFRREREERMLPRFLLTASHQPNNKRFRLSTAPKASAFAPVTLKRNRGA
jgi:hypothetical protein